MRHIDKNKIYNFVATFFHTGRISPIAPGTVGSIAATIVSLLFFYISKNHTATFFLLTIATFVAGVYCSQKIYEITNNKDPQYIVIDEAAGIFFTLFLIAIFRPLSAGKIVCALLFFRIFDIFKPYPIKNVEQNVAADSKYVGLSIMIDDLIASVYAAISVLIVIR